MGSQTEAKRMRQVTNAAELSVKTDEAEKRQSFNAEVAKAKELLEDGGIEEIFRESWSKIIEKAARNKAGSVEFTIRTNLGNDHTVTPTEQATLEVGVSFLRSEGFGADSFFEFYPSGGSDNPYGNHTHIGIMVSW